MSAITFDITSLNCLSDNLSVEDRTHRVFESLAALVRLETMPQEMKAIFQRLKVGIEPLASIDYCIILASIAAVEGKFFARSAGFSFQRAIDAIDGDEGVKLPEKCLILTAISERLLSYDFEWASNTLKDASECLQGLNFVSEECFASLASYIEEVRHKIYASQCVHSDSIQENCHPNLICRP